MNTTTALLAILGPIAGLIAIRSLFSSSRKLPAGKKIGVVITGSTRGLGYALAREFLAQGHRVVISSRTAKSVHIAARELQKDFPNSEIHGHECDVSKPSEVTNLVEFSAKVLGGSIDVWINNAGQVTKYSKIWELDAEHVKQVLDTNLAGTIFCCQEAAKVMQKQEGMGHIFNMEGRGSDGSASPLSAAYGASKAAIPQLTKTLSKEVKGTNVAVHLLSPGMVLTSLLVRDDLPLGSKKIFNILAEHPDTAASWLCSKVISVVANQSRKLTVHRFLTPWGVLNRFLTAPMRKGKFFDDKGNYVYEKKMR
mmetsp:Transcript_24555/g.62175  ORF Transcript_24555/g.62175 Transcript_24555/m.62175 type:complete len:310 (-) Transcript_24555:263-1192(-)